eukprot:CAMPEP_0197853632 /NCGR_PEP_ID=MMETSP1438-20131217/23088_1 /TAXON_ID=1461541 /ORGANISM="Pterosperma sp., Strain CCMP1384" /LENGTH=271 /DNA_ID=CAMNT_0043468109 /DNA_START=49 /DNA_END=864 /DNA_ORIENTATION=+
MASAMASNAMALRSSASSFTGPNKLNAVSTRKAVATRSLGVKVTAEKKMFFPGAVSPDYLDDTLAGDYGWDPLGFGADPVALRWYRQAELQHGRWAMLGTAGILIQEAVNPDVFWYEAGLPENLPEFAQNANLNPGALLAFQFVLMHYVEVRRWQDYKNFGSVNKDPLFSNYEVPNTEMGYPGGIFDPFGFSKGNLKELQTKEIKNGRLAMIAFLGFTIQAQALGDGPIECWKEHLANPFETTILSNLGACILPESVSAGGVTIPTPCLWP